MSDPIQIICTLTGCTQEEAEEAYDKTQDTVEAVDLLLEVPKSTATSNLKKRPREVTQEEQIIAPIRKMLKEMDEKRSTSSYQRGYAGSVEMLDPPEETAPQNSCAPECQPFAHQSEAQKQETACPSQFECSYDLQLNDQTLPCSDRECSQSIPLPEKESLGMDEQIIVEVPSYEPFQRLPITADFVNQ